MSTITGTVRTASISATLGAASIAGAVVAQMPAPGAPVSAVVGRAAGNRITGSVGAAALVGIVTVGGGAAPAGDSWFGSW